MRELDPHAAAPADLEVLLDGGEELVALVPDVAGVEAVALPDDGRERADLVGRAIGAGRVDEPGGESDRAVGEGRREHRLHRGELAARWRPVLRAHDAHPEGAVADERAEIDRAPGALDRVGVLAERGPGPLEVVARELAIELLGREAHDRSGGAAAVPRDDAGDALVHRALERGVLDDRLVGVRMDVDEPPRDDEAARVDRARTRSLTDLADVDHPPVTHRDVGAPPRRAGAIDHRAAVVDELGPYGLSATYPAVSSLR